jgi:alpha/beta superfamily hydrolase
MIPEEVGTLTTSDGVALEARLTVPPSAQGGIVVCHPHPLYGGDMENPVVVRIAEVCDDLGLATLRFNFRGVGRSAGAHDGGAGEQRDVEAALAHLAGLVGAGHPLALAGYSFGATVAAGLAPRYAGLTGLALVAPPLARVDNGPFAGLAAFGERLLLVAGTHDEICPVDALTRLGEALPGATLAVIDGANHFFFGKLFPLGEAVAVWARRTLFPV